VIDQSVRALQGIARLEVSIYADLYYKRLSTIRDETILRSAAASQGLRPCTISFSR
jgi:hypothetical protein